VEGIFSIPSIPLLTNVPFAQDIFKLVVGKNEEETLADITNAFEIFDRDDDGRLQTKELHRSASNTLYVFSGKQIPDSCNSAGPMDRSCRHLFIVLGSHLNAHFTLSIPGPSPE